MRIFIFFLLLRALAAFNLEPRIALVKKGPKGTYFGLDVSPHQILNSEENSRTSTLLVGAPLDSYGGTGNTGVLYTCPLTSYENDCEKVLDVPSAKDQRSLEEAAGQWLGVTVNSQGPGMIFF